MTRYIATWFFVTHKVYEETRPHVACEFLIPKTHSSKCHFYEIKLGRTNNRLQILVTGHVGCYRTVCWIILQEWTGEAKQNQIKSNWLVTLWKLSKWMTKILYVSACKKTSDRSNVLIDKIICRKRGNIFLKLLLFTDGCRWIVLSFGEIQTVWVIVIKSNLN